MDFKMKEQILTKELVEQIDLILFSHNNDASQLVGILLDIQAIIPVSYTHLNKVEFVLVEAASRVEALEANKVDIILANFTVTPERKEKVDFANPYMKVGLGVVSPDGALITDEMCIRDRLWSWCRVMSIWR